MTPTLYRAFQPTVEISGFDADSGELYAIPRAVGCKHCQCEFPTTDYE